jgi:hypothetical protein
MFFAVYTVYRTGLSFQSLQTCLLTTEILSGTILVILQSHTHGHFSKLDGKFPLQIQFLSQICKTTSAVCNSCSVQYG